MSGSLAIWAVSDGRAGIENQVLGLAEAVARLVPVEITVKRVAYRGRVGRWPQLLNLTPRRALVEPLQPPWPDLWIAAGRATLPLSTRVRRWSGGHTFAVQLQHPRWPVRLFDLVIAPEHDRLHGPNVLSIVGSTNRVSNELLQRAAAEFSSNIEGLARPRVAVLAGGNSNAFDFYGDVAGAIGEQVGAAVRREGGSALVTFSRRTPLDAKTSLRAALGDAPSWVWDGEGSNPYFAFLSAADVFVVTEDSVNMTTEAAWTGKPIYSQVLDGGSGKFRRFHAGLRARGVTRPMSAIKPFIDATETWTYEPLRETERAARAVVDALIRRGQL